MTQKRINEWRHSVRHCDSFALLGQENSFWMTEMICCQPLTMVLNDQHVIFIESIPQQYVSLSIRKWFWAVMDLQETFVITCEPLSIIVSVYYSLLWHATTLVSFIYTWSELPTKFYWLLYSDWFTSYLIFSWVPYHSHLLLLLNHVLIVVEPCCYCCWTMLLLFLNHVVLVVETCCYCC